MKAAVAEATKQTPKRPAAWCTVAGGWVKQCCSRKQAYPVLRWNPNTHNTSTEAWIKNASTIPDVGPTWGFSNFSLSFDNRQFVQPPERELLFRFMRVLGSSILAEQKNALWCFCATTPLSVQGGLLGGLSAVTPSKSRHGSTVEASGEQTAGCMVHALLPTKGDLERVSC